MIPSKTAVVVLSGTRIGDGTPTAGMQMVFVIIKRVYLGAGEKSTAVDI
jgi:hypothetical protein